MLIRTALHHLRERLYGCLLGALEAALCQQGADHDLQGAAPRQVVVLCWAGGGFTPTPPLEHMQGITHQVGEKKGPQEDKRSSQSERRTT